jgi:subtilisin family serine protease
MKKFFIILFFYPLLLSAQSTQENNGVIVIYDKKDIEKLTSQLSQQRNTSISYTKLGSLTQTYLLTGDDDQIIYDLCKNHPEIQAVEINKKVSNRLKPNDLKLNEQYYLDLIQAYTAWDISSGGTNNAGVEIVIGIVDDGYDINHEDLSDNIYTNPNEIPGDGKDNDGNGYIDDVHGWNTKTNTGIHDIKSHGTNILGVLGAKGNNQKGISGINWNIRLLPVTTGNLVSDVIKGYEYLLAERKLYNSSSGNKGANIVVTSYSGGLSRAFAVDHPIWCAIYDKIGAEGVLSVTATTNDDDNVDEVGDMPSTCGSEYLVVVNSSNKADEKDNVTGYGKISVDISAPGDRILTTELGSKGLYRTESGTSLATPMVASAIALLYSIKCNVFYTLTVEDSKKAALIIKNVIMKSVDLKESLKSKTVSGGRLNVYKSMNMIINDYCQLEIAPKGKLKINNVTYVDDVITIDYLSENTNTLILAIYDSAGKEVIRTSFAPPLFGKKEYSISTDQYLSGSIYFASLISGNEVASKGFNAKDPTK